MTLRFYHKTLTKRAKSPLSRELRVDMAADLKISTPFALAAGSLFPSSARFSLIPMHSLDGEGYRAL